MRVVVVGATGHVGTAVLTALADQDDVEILGIARRLPDRTVAPYDAAEWTTADVGAETLSDRAEDELIDALAEAFAGADAVIHLAWLIQPNHDRALLRRTNVEGTRRVAQACARAGVGQLVCASSWAAYSPQPEQHDLSLQDESWPVHGVPSSHYSVDKAAQERVLDELESQHPGIVVTRMRMALVFSRHAGAQVGRYFLGPWVPRSVLAPGRLPVLPSPIGLRVQVVHASDAARAYVAAVRRKAGGAFNITTGEVLGAAELAEVVDHGLSLPLPSRALRPLWHYAWRARIAAADPGWLDLATSLPAVDPGRARRELGWQPRHDARSAVRDMLRGLTQRTGRPTLPMRAHDRAFEGVPGQRPGLRGRGQLTGSGPVDRKLLRFYLDDHLTGASGGVQRIERMAHAYADTVAGDELLLLAAEIGDARRDLIGVMDRLGLRRRQHRHAAAWVAERGARLKTNGRISTSPLSALLELEIMRAAVTGQAGLWQTLTDLAEELGLDRAAMEQLSRRSEGFAERLADLHGRVRTSALRVPERVDTTDPATLNAVGAATDMVEPGEGRVHE
ncbi:NAD-dependent epimerase/dehydratase family protein [Bogoriella caseilytica]|uniref:Nucleoside-diphosphate-sugar epimerase n=1 Tax=Bogoriella caseilytica TaxID=56055 RepID=A0A3N2BCH3_9MICO|nr:NAD-dependent epimerase/dehydratase family protein [Bogoriella caseilytica]ROR72764.1 nucleoside-diphosphate-sugar epimerase [Bogoriella caseilytica]